MEEAAVRREVVGKDEKRRHWCLSAWLIVMMVMHAFAVLVYVLAGMAILPLTPEPAVSVVMIIALAALAALSLTFVIALWRWKRWGFWGYCGTCLLAIGINVSIGTGAPSFMGLLGIVILYVVLQIGGEKKGWPQLE